RFQLCADPACPILVADAITDEEIRHLQYPPIRNVAGSGASVERKNPKSCAPEQFLRFRLGNRDRAARPRAERGARVAGQPQKSFPPSRLRRTISSLYAFAEYAARICQGQLAFMVAAQTPAGSRSPSSGTARAALGQNVSCIVQRNAIFRAADH